MAHANAALTPEERLELVVEDGWPIARAAEYFHASWPTVKRWVVRYLDRVVLGSVSRADMGDASSRPHRSPTKPRCR